MQSRALCWVAHLAIHIWTTYRQHMCQAATNNHFWLSTTDTMHARGCHVVYNMQRRRALTGGGRRNTHFLMVFFAFALFFLAWSARTVKRHQWPIILLLSGCRLGWHSWPKKGMTLSEAKDKATSPYSSETRSLFCIMSYVRLPISRTQLQCICRSPGLILEAI